MATHLAEKPEVRRLCAWRCPAKEKKIYVVTWRSLSTCLHLWSVVTPISRLEAAQNIPNDSIRRNWRASERIYAKYFGIQIWLEFVPRMLNDLNLEMILSKYSRTALPIREVTFISGEEVQMTRRDVLV